VLDPGLVAGDPVFLEPGLAFSGDPVEFPPVPRADEVIAVEAALAERASDVVADPGDHPEGAADVADRERRLVYGDRPEGGSGVVGDRS
jgi:hypothetical protein